MTGKANQVGAALGAGLLSRAAVLFDLVELPTMDIPARFAVALPGETLLKMRGFPQAALPEAGRMASGRGASAEECRVSCLGEAVELVSCCAWGDESLVTGTEHEVGPAALLPEALNGFTDAQLDRRAEWNRNDHGFDWRPAPRDRGRPLDWLAVDNAFGGVGAFVPADFAFIGRRQPGDETAVAIGDSNGCAAGPEAETARLAAALELVERDAVGRWWYGRRQRAAVDWADIRDIGELATWLGSRPRRSWLFDITTDLGIPVIAAASAEPDHRDVALGFAARLNSHEAAIAALTEMLQMEVSLATSRILGDRAPGWRQWRNAVRMTTPPLAAALQLPTARLRSSELASAGESLSIMLDAMARRHVDLWFANMTRVPIGVPAWRAVSTTLCHHKPRFARFRVLAPDPRDLGRIDGPPEAQIPLLI
jgi:ribosomal protein S12 methylthiotransferase accessory factor